MALSPVGGMIYVNQNMHIGATKQLDFQNRIDLQNAAAATILDEKDKEIEELRPTEESHKIDPEHEHDKKRRDREEQKKRKKSKSQSDKESKEEIILPPHLDIVV
jgi:hypothetical protein